MSKTKKDLVNYLCGTVPSAPGVWLQRGDYDRLALWLGKCLELDIDPDELKTFCEKAKKTRNYPLGPSDDVRMWCRNRLAEMGAIRVGCAVNDLSFFVPLHVFFTSLEETPDMLERLKEPGAGRSGPARSKISKTNAVIVPIDKNAARVAPDFLANITES